jgi:hypothetical protein
LYTPSFFSVIPWKKTPTSLDFGNHVIYMENKEKISF